MRHLLISLIMLLGILPVSAQQPQTLDQVTARFSKKCPSEISDGMTLVKAETADSLFILSYTISDEMFDNISTLGGILHDSMLAEMESSPDPLIKELLAACKASKTKIVQRFTNSAGKTFDIIILPTEI